MKKMILLPYNRYQCLMSTNESSNKGVKTDVNEAEQTFLESNDEQNVTKGSEVTKPDGDGNTLESLLPHFSKSIRNRMHSLLYYIKPHVSWNSKGEVILKDTLIPGSNIVDLINVHMKDYKDFRPVGKDAFSESLIKLNILTSLLAASARQQIGKGSTIPPPPGVPVKRKLSVKGVPRKIKWLRL